MNHRQTEVLIIGGGFAGVAVAQGLAKEGVEVTLVDKKEYFEVTFATLRNVTAPRLHGNTPRKLYRDFLKGTFIQAGVSSMTHHRVELDTGESIEFQQAIIATGSRYPTLPEAKTLTSLTYAARNQEMQNAHQSLTSAASVLIIGGGSVGVELAGEIASAFPDKSITLAHSGDRLLESSPPKAQLKAWEQLIAKGIKVKFNRRFKKQGDAYRCEKTGETLSVDKAYECVGMMPNTEFLQSNLSGVLDTKGLVKVDEMARVQGYDNLYALGDCSTLDSRKHGFLASVQGGFLAKNIAKSIKGKKVKTYKTPPLVMVTPTGTDSGVAQLPFGVTTMKFVIGLKQKDMGITNMYKMYGTTPDLRAE
ncbi:NAD(P)/FAD-dependent oxidoreductase [Pleionea sp. CnH1-48]|uniref:NAD(P)/FAD-dependent oxidoreductase n=1 Tax=Pleionea sp. CnH1-48 TaxID=2954494 RepID=UPI002097FC32|nr:FAD-dependent oxidoreductase [Pleionea sp. CnH1-48]MCO7222715.1 FAD-dependent oxidoreductase [Pleionea sp. CnH1-48]